MSWENWILRHHSDVTTTYDWILKMAVENYGLKEKNRRQAILDKRHCLILWWQKNRKNFKSYQTATSLGKLLGLTHCTIIHYQKNRKKTLLYQENTKCLNDFLNS